MNNNTNLSSSFNKLIANYFPKYKGVTIERVPDGFMVFGRKYPSWEKATKLINNSIIHHE